MSAGHGGALAAARELFARSLVANLELRRYARSFFDGACRLKCEATAKGKQEIDPTHELYRVVSTLHRASVPVAELLPPPVLAAYAAAHSSAIFSNKAIAVASAARAAGAVFFLSVSASQGSPLHPCARYGIAFALC